MSTPSPPIIIDSGATGHFFKISSNLLGLKPTPNSIAVSLPDGALIRSTHTGTLPVHGLPLSACRAHVFPSLQSHSLLSIGQLYNHGCKAVFTHNGITITRNDLVLLTGTRSSATNGLWTLDPLDPTTTPAAAPSSPITGSANAMFHTTLAHDTVANRIAFYHASLFSPSLSTWCHAIDAGHFPTWPGLTSSTVRKYPPQSIPVRQGHLHQVRANIRSTCLPASSIQQPTSDADLEDDAAPPAEDNTRTRIMYADCHCTTGMVYTDPTRKFLVPSVSGHQYILDMYEYDSNYIHAEPMIDRIGPSIIAAYQRSIIFLQSRGLKPLLQRLDNKATGALQDFLVTSDIDFQLAPPHVHCRSAAKRAIRTFKNHFIVGLCSTNPDFPLNLWDKLLPQCLITLSLLRQSRINPQLSAQAHINGAFDFDRTTLAPSGTKVLIHEKPSARGTWAPHAVEGWYLGPYQRHYRCYRVWAWATTSERIVDTLAWFPTTVIMPRHSSTDVAIAAAHDLAQAMLSPSPSSPVSPITDSQRHQLLQLSNIFLQHTS
jgi:hypothetical protein